MGERRQQPMESFDGGVGDSPCLSGAWSASGSLGVAVSVATGRFGAMMEVELLNAGPVTIVVDVTEGRIH